MSLYNIRTIELTRNSSLPLGICISRNKVKLEVCREMQFSADHFKNISDNGYYGVFVSKLIPDCMAAKEGLLHVGDEILTVNTISVSSLDIRVIATLLCKLKRLILTIRTWKCNKNLNSPNCLINTTLPNHVKDNCQTVHLPTCFVPPKSTSNLLLNSNIKNSVYDNNFDELSKVSSSSIDSLLKLKFDESLDILFEAIACCNKSTMLSENKNFSNNSRLLFPDYDTISDKSIANDARDHSENKKLLSKAKNLVNCEESDTNYICSPAQYLQSSSEQCISSQTLLQEINVDDNCFVSFQSPNNLIDISTFDNSQKYSTNRIVPKFPINLADTSSIQTTLQPRVDVAQHPHVITVDKKRQWLNRTKTASDELQKQFGDECKQLHNSNNFYIKETKSSDNQVFSDKANFISSNKLSSSDQNHLKSQKLLDENDKIGSDSKRSADVQKVTSPGRFRKKYWSKKISKKFRISGNSESGLSDYACWTSENPEKTSSSEARSSDLPVSNHFHLNQNQQRPLSRRLSLNNKNKENRHKYLLISQFQEYKPLPVIGDNSLLPVDGCLVITLYGVKQLKKSLCEASCIVQVDDAVTKRISTTMQTCQGATTWNQCFEMIVNQARNLHFTVYTWDTHQGKHKISADAVINLPFLTRTCISNLNYSNRLALVMRPRGVLYIRLAVENNPSSRGPFLFGTDLQNISDREGNGKTVPVIVRSCLLEVEKRGMHVVGIYRLCGSAIMKKELRKKLEESDGFVDLGNCNDINVITGILKDFLRELPQPLFSPELLQTVSSAMNAYPSSSSYFYIKEGFPVNHNHTSLNKNLSKELDDTQKLRTLYLLEKIENIPSSKAEKATLYALMNHLKKVSLQSDKNKMTCQNLAVCFGPVLLGPINFTPISRLDLEAALDFKRHIQILSYMISNWPDQAIDPPFVVSRKNHGYCQDEKRVSLTRRLSRVCKDESVGHPSCEEGQVLMVNISENCEAFYDL